MSEVLVTNNPLVHNKYFNECQVEFYDVDYIKILEVVRDKIHQGHKLLSHPLSSSLKPNETPYKTIIISKNSSSLDVNSLKIIESSLMTAAKFMKNQKTPEWNKQALDDFQAVDLSLIQNALASII